MQKRRVGTQRECVTRWARNMQTRASQLGVQQWPQGRMQSAQGGQSGGMSTWRRRWAAGAAECSYEQEAAVVEEDEEMEREDVIRTNEGWRSGQTSTSWMCRNRQNWHWIK